MSVNPFIRVLMLLFCLVSIAPPFTQAYGAEPVRIGVLAFRPKPLTLAQWQPLAVALKQALPEHDFVVEAFTYPELEEAVASRQLDFVLTNSGHYVQLAERSGLSSPLATVAVNDHGRSSTVFGGVIFCRAEQAEMNSLGDIKGKTVAVTDTKSLGGYQMQAYELSLAGVCMPDVKLLSTGMPHDKAVEAVLAGQADVGFVRSGVLEGMERDGKLDIKQLKILNRKNLPGFRQYLSTQLYPEWPFAAMLHVDEKLARRVAAALFMLEDSKAATSAMGIYGFVIPADYSPVEKMLRELRFPPFEVAPAFTLQDVWLCYRWQMMAGMFALAVIVFLGVSLLLTNRKLKAKQLLLLQQQQELQASEEKFRTVSDYTYDWEIWEDPVGSCLYCSPSCERITGYSAEAFMTDPGLLARLIHPEDLPGWKAHYADVHDGTEAQQVKKRNANELEFRIIGHNGEVRWINHLCYHIHDGDGLDLGHRISNRDITQRVQAEEKLQQYADSLERSNRDLEHFAYVASHDLQEPLRKIGGFSELLARNYQGRLDEKADSYIHYIVDGAQRMQILINDLLTFSRVTTKGKEFAAVDCNALLARVQQDLELVIKESGARLIVGELPTVIADEGQLGQVFQNLIGNAVKYCMLGQPPEIAVAAVERHGDWIFSVQDSGIGIDPQYFERVFQLFQRLHTREEYAGTGIGLAMCKKIVERHGGKIWIESAAGKGSTFFFTVPSVSVRKNERQGV